MLSCMKEPDLLLFAERGYQMRRFVILGLVLGTVFGVWDLIVTLLNPLSEDDASALLMFYGPMFFIFALFLLTIVLALSAFIPGFSPVFLLGAIATLIGSIVSLRRGDNFNQEFYR